MPLNMMIKPSSSACNMRCKYCFYKDVSENRDTRSYGMMSMNTLDAIVRKVFESADGYVGFIFQGGEPTLAGMEFYKRLVKLQKRYNQSKIPVYNSIQTNGYVIDDKWAEFFSANRFLVGISLDGPQNIHDEFRIDAKNNGTFNKVMKAVKLLERHKVEFNILCVVNGVSAKKGKEIYNFFKNQNLRYLQFIPCVERFNGGFESEYSLDSYSYGAFLKDVFDEYYNDFINGNYISIRNFDNYIGMLMGKRPESCGMSGVCSCNFTVESDGSVYPCDFYVLDEYKLGNIKQNSFYELFNSEQAKDFIAVSEYIAPDCKDCQWFALCRGGCRRNREPVIDGKLSLNWFCGGYKYFFAHSYEKMRRMADILSKGINV